MAAIWITRLVGRTSTVSTRVSSLPPTGLMPHGVKWSRKKLQPRVATKTSHQTRRANTQSRVRLVATARRAPRARPRARGRRIFAHPRVSDRQGKRTSGDSWRTPTHVIHCIRVLAQQEGLCRVLFGIYRTSELADPNTRTSLTARAITGALLRVCGWGKGHTTLA